MAAARTSRMKRARGAASAYSCRMTFHSHPPPQLLVPGRVDPTHSTLAEFTFDQIARLQFLADERCV